MKTFTTPQFLPCFKYIYCAKTFASLRKFLVPVFSMPGVGALLSDVTYRRYAPTAHESLLLWKQKGVGGGVNGERGGKVENRPLCLL
jgi:hypothetical protein